VIFHLVSLGDAPRDFAKNRGVTGDSRLRPALEGQIGRLAAARAKLLTGLSFHDGDSRRCGILTKVTAADRVAMT